MQKNCMVFLLAGYETTSTALGFLCYELALNQEVQKTLQKEVDRYFPNDVRFFYNFNVDTPG